METKVIQAEIIDLKAAADGTHTFTAYASTFGTVDRTGDVVIKGAFADTLKERKRRPLLWQHQANEPIGVEQTLVEDQHGLLGTWKLVDTARGEDAYKLLKAGAIDSMSIGYVPVEVGYDEEAGIRKLLKIELLENSVVSIPANEEARVTGVKSFEHVLARAIAERFSVPASLSVDDVVNGLARYAKQHGELEAVKTEVPFEDLIGQITAHLMLGVDEAEALHGRRLEEKRMLSDSHLSVLDQFLAQLKGSSDRIEAIINRSGRTAEAEANSDHPLLELRRRKARRGEAQ